MLKIAGLLVLAGQALPEVLEAADRVAQNPGVRKLLSMLNTCGEIQGLMGQGWFGFAPEGGLMLEALVRRLSGLRQALAQGRSDPDQDGVHLRQSSSARSRKSA